MIFVMTLKGFGIWLNWQISDFNLIFLLNRIWNSRCYKVKKSDICLLLTSLSIWGGTDIIFCLNLLHFKMRTMPSIDQIRYECSVFISSSWYVMWAIFTNVKWYCIYDTSMYSTLLKVGFELLRSLILSVAGKYLFREVDKWSHKWAKNCIK